MTMTLTAQPLPLRMDPDGTVRIGSSRVLLEMVVNVYLAGETPEAIAYDFDTVDLADVYGVISYYLRNRAEVDAYLEEGRRQAEAFRRKMEAIFPSDGLRERLLARRGRGATSPA